VNREQFYAIMNGEGTLDYELYLRTKALLGCQTDYAECATRTSCSFKSFIKWKSSG
jgi:tryptophan 2,3-dioxygenase